MIPDLGLAWASHPKPRRPFQGSRAEIKTTKHARWSRLLLLDSRTTTKVQADLTKPKQDRVVDLVTVLNETN